MESKKPRILIISSANPTIGPGIGALKVYRILKTFGFEVDLLTKYKVRNYPEVLSIYDKFEEERTFIEKLIALYKSVYNRFFFKQKKTYYFFYKKETNPPMSISSVLHQINKSYDIVHIYFWQGMLSFQTIKAIYGKLHCMFYFACADYSVMSGGCHFTGECQKYKTGCGSCPAIYSNNPNDFTSFNVKYRRKILDEINPYIAANNYMIKEFFSKSFLLKNYPRIISSYPIMELDVFHPLEKDKLREEFYIQKDKTFICFFGSQNLNDDRKGISYLLEALQIFYSMLSEYQRKNILLLLAGKNIDEIKDKLLFDYKYLGYLSSDLLPKVYSLSNVFLSPSVNDAGPTMLVQSLACGTPVVAFEMGYAIDFIKDKNTGYCAQLRNSKDFAKGIMSIYNMDKKKYTLMREQCRKLMEEKTSPIAFINSYLDLYYKQL